MVELKGVIPILPAPFTENGMDVDYEGLRNVVDRVIAEGVHGVALLGVASEFYKVSDEERIRMIETVVVHTAKRVPVIVNITKHSFEAAVKDARYAQEVGADAVMIIPPYFMSPSNAAVLQHIRMVVESVDLPLIIQYAPDVTGVGIPLETFLEIARRGKQPVYIKAESIPPGALITSLIEKSEGKLGVFIGNSGKQMLDALNRGALGLMPGTSMVKIYVDIYNEFKSGMTGAAFDHFNKLLPIINLCSQTAETLIKYEKIILKSRGIIKSDYCRSPSYTPDEQYLKLLEKHLENLREHFQYPAQKGVHTL